jgi:general secretion pathway protein B
MSYILDALRRAEAERERGGVPGLQSQQHSIEGEDDAPERSRPLVWAVVGLALALVATLAWTLLGRSPGPSRQSAEGPVTQAPAPATAPAPQSLAEIAAAPATSPAPQPASTQPPSSALAPDAAQPPSVTPPVRAPAVAALRAAPQAASPPPVRSPAAMPVGPATRAPRAEAPAVAADTGSGRAVAGAADARPAPPAATASEPRVYAQSELPEEIRRELPRIAVNGSSYSGDAASRMVMINGQVFHEGDPLAAGLVLDKIKRRSAVLAYKGWRYEITF